VDNEVHTCNNKCQRPACVAVREAVAAEREACAKICDELDVGFGWDATAHDCADLIRARGNK